MEGERRVNSRLSPGAERTLDELEGDPDADDLVDAIWSTIENIAEDPGSADVRRRSLRTLAGQTVWMVRVPIGRPDPWVVLWQPRADEVLIAYIGPEDFRVAKY